MSAYKYLFKFIIIGDSFVGKSCLVHQFLENSPLLEHETTVGIEFGVKEITIQNAPIRLSIWDTAGQESFRSLIRAYYRSAIGVLLCYDATSMRSFTNLEQWVQEVQDNGNENVVIALVCNKIDLEARQVTSIQGRQYAVDHGFLYAEVSAIKGTGVEQIFKDMAIEVIFRIDNGLIAKNQPGVTAGSAKPQQNVISLEQEETEQKQQHKNNKSCC